MKHKRKSKMREDGPELIAICLDCEKDECSNCLAHNPANPGKPRKGRGVIAFRDGEEDMIFDSAADAADFFHVTVGAIQSAAYRGKTSQGYFWRYQNG